MQSEKDKVDYAFLKDEIERWSSELGFQQIGVSDIDLLLAEEKLADWLQNKFHGTMEFVL